MIVFDIIAIFCFLIMIISIIVAGILALFQNPYAPTLAAISVLSMMILQIDVIIKLTVSEIRLNRTISRINRMPSKKSLLNSDNND